MESHDCLRPLGLAQHSVWQDMQAHPERASLYNLGAYFEYRCAIQVDCMLEALRRVVEEVTATRLRIRSTGSGLAQWVAPAGPADVPLVDLSGERDPAITAETWMRADMAEPFASLEESLCRFQILKLGLDRYYIYAKWSHLIADGFGMDVVGRRKLQIYFALCRGDIVERQPNDYLAFLEAELRYRDSSDWAADRAYWRELLAGVEAPASLSRTQQTDAQERGARLLHRVSAERMENLRSGADKCGIRLSQYVLSAIASYLACVAGRDEVVVGLPVHGRPRSGPLAHVVGMCVNVLPLRVVVRRGSSIGEVAKTLERQMKEALTHSRYHHSDLRRDFGAEFLRGALFRVTANIMQWTKTAEFSALPVRTHILNTGPIEDLSIILYAREGDAQSDLVLDYNPRRYEQWEIGAHQDNLLAAFDRLSNPDLLARTLLHSPRSHAAAKRDDIESPCFVHDVVGLHARSSPDRIAVRCGAVQLSYGELEARSNRIARYLITLGIGRESVVAVWMRPSHHAVVAILGIWKSGAAYLPIDADQPESRIRRMLEECAASVIIREAAVLAPRAEEPAFGVRDLVMEAFDWDAWSPAPPRVAVTPGDLAYIIYTSGSTGTPKAVLVEHRGLTNPALMRHPSFGLSSDSRLLQCSRLGFDASVWEIGAALSAGAMLCMTGDLPQNVNLKRLLARERATAMLASPSRLRQLSPVDFPDLQTVIVGGEAAAPDQLEEWAGHCRVVNAYGPTEATIIATVHEYVRGSLSASIGSAIEGVRVFVVDADGAEMPIGVPGEICIGGVGVARGYLTRSCANDGGFIQGDDASRVYRTGDVGRLKPDGTIDFLGRRDSQIKVHGVRIEPAEIERALRAHAAVADAAVVVARDSRQLVTHILLRDPSVPVAARSLAAFLATSLPPYMIPTAFVMRTSWPVTPSGKLDRNALAAEAHETSSRHPHKPPDSDTECALVSVWGELLGVVCGVDDNFFELGGDSLKAIELVYVIERQLGVQLEMSAIYENQTVTTLACHIDSLLAHGGSLSPRLGKRARPDIVPASINQASRAEWLRAKPKSLPNTYGAMRIRGPIDHALVAHALRYLVERHEALRTDLPMCDGMRVQRIHVDPDIRIASYDLSTLAQAEREARLARIVTDAVVESFDIERGPLLRAIHVYEGSDSHYLGVAVDHIVFDGRSSSIFWTELTVVMRALLRNEQPQLPQIGIQFADYAVWEREMLTERELKRLREHWAAELVQPPQMLGWKCCGARPKPYSYRARVLSWALPRATSERLAALARQEASTLYIVLNTMFAILIRDLSDQQAFLMHTVTANRIRRELENTIGYFTNPLIYVVRASNNFRESLARNTITAMRAYAHSQLPAKDLFEIVGQPPDDTFGLRWQVSHVHENFPQPEALDWGTHQVAMCELRSANTDVASTYDLALLTRETTSGISCSLWYNPDVFPPGVAEQARATFERSIEVLTSA